MTELERLRKEVDDAAQLLREAQVAHDEAAKKYINAKQAYDREYRKSQNCTTCRYSIVLDFSLDGWHNLCGCENAPCTCCNTVCDYYKPDNRYTKTLKENILSKEYRQISPEEYEGFKSLGFDLFEDDLETTNERYEIAKAEKVVKILKILNPAWESDN